MATFIYIDRNGHTKTIENAHFGNLERTCAAVMFDIDTRVANSSSKEPRIHASLAPSVAGSSLFPSVLPSIAGAQPATPSQNSGKNIAEFKER